MREVKKTEVVESVESGYFKVEAIYNNQNDLYSMSTIEVFRKSLDNTEWVAVPLKLSITSYFKVLFTRSWPPSGFEKVELKDNSLQITFEDEEEIWEKPIMPFNLDKECRWLAKFCFTKNNWSLERLNYLVFED
ncbi:MAG: hypothetical protein COB58_04125 [Thalassobium sp.]|nr:MAG: hypothetical protein COB43_06165 [Oceanospirillales bacterium]PHQ87553.1 MAG: hypothetical protein COB58_04125 [Thalassobium sp.]